MKKRLLFLTTAWAVMSLMAAYALAIDVLPGDDLFESPPGFSNASPVIPANFFGPGSDPFTGTIELRGQSLEQTGSNLGRTSTVVRRLATASLPGPYGSSDTVPIEIIALNLVSIEPIIVTYDGGLNPEEWDVRVNLSSTDPQVQGTMTINQEYTNGGTFSASLPVTTRFTFTRVSDNMEMVLDPAPMEIMETPPIPPLPAPAEACWSYYVDFPIVTSDGTSTVDHDGNHATPHVAVGPSSNFVAGGCGFTASHERPFADDPVDHQQKVLDPETAAWAAHGVQPTNPLDHFKVYDVDSVVVAHSVILEDQFDTEVPETGTLVKIDRFANPVDKNQEGIADPNSHLVWYRYVPMGLPIIRDVRVDNQFGTRWLRIADPQYLLVPAEKVEPGSEFPINLDHYKCYRVIGGASINATVSLDDQFGHEDVEVLDPVWFCNPVSKNDEGIISEVDHLVFYDITPKDQYSIDITADDQFERRALHVNMSRWLGVPTEKLEVQYPTPTGHYKAYDVYDIDAQYPVTLVDQFDTLFVDLEKIDCFANPVDKNGEGIPDLSEHLVWYKFTKSGSTLWRDIVFDNQFGRQQVTVGAPEYLLVPAEKIETGSVFPDTLDHYECYRVIRGDSVNTFVTLDDQFGHEDVDVLEPVWFCNPVDKNSEGIYNDEKHLVFYNITPSTHYTNLSIEALDQFGITPMDVDSSLWLGVPSIKVSVVTGVEDLSNRPSPPSFALYQNVPNPFNPTTTIRFDVPPGGGHVTLRIYDVQGKLVQTLVDGVLTAGGKQAFWDSSNARGNTVASGIYFYRMTAPGFEMTRKMVLLK